jgi:hypothetical protein
MIEAAEPSVAAIMQAIVKGDCQPFGQPVPVVLNLQQQFYRLKRMIKKFSHI